MPDAARGWEYVGFLPSVVSRVLGEGGFEGDPAVRTWKDRGWLTVSEGRERLRVRIGREAAWVIALTRAGIEAAGAVSC